LLINFSYTLEQEKEIDNAEINDQERKILNDPSIKKTKGRPRILKRKVSFVNQVEKKTKK